MVVEVAGPADLLTPTAQASDLGRALEARLRSQDADARERRGRHAVQRRALGCRAVIEGTLPTIHAP